MRPSGLLIWSDQINILHLRGSGEPHCVTLLKTFWNEILASTKWTMTGQIDITIAIASPRFNARWSLFSFWWIILSNGFLRIEKNEKNLSVTSLNIFVKCTIEIITFSFSFMCAAVSSARKICCGHKFCVRDTKMCPGLKKCFRFCSETILCPQQMFPSLRSPKNIMSSNVFATMCPRLPGTSATFEIIYATDPLLQIWQIVCLSWLASNIF